MIESNRSVKTMNGLRKWTVSKAKVGGIKAETGTALRRFFYIVSEESSRISPTCIVT